MIYFLVFIALFILLFFISKELTRSISFILYKITKSQEKAIRIFHFLFLPGVLVHELSHLISAEVMFVHTSGLSLTPKKIEDQLVMGSVQIQKTDPIRRAIIGFAPVLVGFLIISVTSFYFLSDKSFFGLFPSYVLVFFIVFEIGNTMFSSRKDLEGTVELLIFLATGFIIAYILGFHFESLFNYLNSSKSEDILIKGIKILLIPIVIDLVIIFFAKLLTKVGRTSI